MQNQSLVAIHHTKSYTYDDTFSYKNINGKGKLLKNLPGDKHVNKGVESLFFLLKMDRDNYGTEKWNPLKGIINADDTVLIKPNLVGIQPSYLSKGWTQTECVATHGSVIHPLIRYVHKATGDGGKIIVADAPMDITEFDKITNLTQLKPIIEHLRNEQNIPVELLDLRQKYVEKWTWEEKNLKGDPNGYIEIDLKENSEFTGLNGTFQAAASYGYESNLPDKYHKGNHIYEIPKSVIMADCVINVPKLKTHNMAGVTLSLKNMVGISSKKNWLPHHRNGSMDEGGDEYPEKSNILHKKDMWTHQVSKLPLGKHMLKFGAHILYSTKYRKGHASTTIRNGEWFGNDTVWRMVLDLNKILFYCNAKGELNDNVQRKYLTIIDGIVGGEGEGPMRCVPKRCGLLIGGYNPLAVDIKATEIMGFDPLKIPMLNNATKMKNHPIGINKYESVYNENINELNIKFKPPFGWQGHIELA